MEHNPLSSSQDPVEHMLQDVGREPTELRPEIKRLHKQQLLSLAERLQKEASTAAAPADTTNNPSQLPQPPRQSWWHQVRYVLGGASAGFAVTMAVLMLVVRGPGSGTFDSIDAFGRVLVPAAHAQDAFQIYTDTETPKTADSSALILRSKVALSPEQVERVLKVDTGHIHDVEKLSSDAFRVRIAAVPSDKIVRVALPVAIQTSTSTDETIPREYSWALQTTDKLELVSSLPANNANYVPLDTSLELVMNAQGFSNVTTSIEISPATEGYFQLNGRRIVFLPTKALQPSTLYTIRIKQGLAADGLSLPQDLALQFQTGDASQDSTNAPWMRVTNEFQEAYLGDAISIQVSRSPGLVASTSKIAVTGYRLTEDEAVQFLQKRVPYSASFGSADNFGQYTQFAKIEAFQAELPLFRPSERDSELVTLPKLSEQGWYMVRLTCGGVDAWTFVQVTNLATYVVADKDQLLVWAVSADTQQSLVSLPVRLQDGPVVQTDNAGLARLATPEFLKSTTTRTESGVAVMRLGDASGPVRALAVVGPTLASDIFNRGAPAHEQTWGYLYPDRPLYHPTDEMHVAGIIQDRDGKTALRQAELRLTKGSYIEDLTNGQNRIYASAPLSLDAAGRYEATLAWTNVSPGYYQLDLLRDGELVMSRWVEVRQLAKPTYYLDVALSAERLLAGQEFQARLQATFFNGAAVPKARLRVHVSQGDTVIPDQEVTLDDQGRFTLPLKALPVTCGQRFADTCRNTEQLTLMVYPVGGEEAQVLGSAMADVAGSDLDIRGDVTETDGRAELSFQSYHRDLNKPFHETGLIWSGRTLRGQIVGIRYERIQDGVWYDAIEKRVVPYYRYERRQDPPVEFTVQTDVNGKASHTFVLQSDRDFYEVAVQGEDVTGRFSRFTTSAARGWYLPENREASPRLTLEGKGENRDVHVGEILKPTLNLGTSPYDATKGPGVLFLMLSRGIQQVTRTSSASWETTFTDSLVPNATLRGVTFHNRRFQTSDVVVFLEKETKELDVSVTTDQLIYRPGQKMTVRFQVKPKQGQATLADTKIAYAIVDEALLSVWGVYEEDPLLWLHNYVTDGVLFRRASHQGDLLATDGGGEKGGGGGGFGDGPGGVRRLFKDTAAHGIVMVDSQGIATAEVILPDNLTSWRITAVALGSDLRAGVGVQSVKASKDIFVDAVVPARALTSDQVILKLRAFGTGLKTDRPVTFMLNAPSLGLKNYTASGTAETPVYIALPKLISGTHAMTVGVQQDEFTDRVERTMEVVATRLERSEIVMLESAAGTRLSTADQSTIELVVASQGRSSLYPAVRTLAESASLRSDARVAAFVARELLKTAYNQTFAPDDATLLDIQTAEEGGIHLLPYGSSDTALSMQVALTKPEVVDAWQLRSSLATKLVHGASRLERLQAMAGLAALRAPVVLDLQQAAALTDRTSQETITVIEGLVAAGDVERAGQLMREVLISSTYRDGERFLKIGSESSPETYEATAELATLAERLVLPEAPQLARFVDHHWSAEAFPVLAKARFLTYRLQHLPTEDGSLTWTDGARTETVDLKTTPLHTIVLSPDQVAKFQVVAVSGPVHLSYARLVSGLPAKHPTLSLTRRYDAGKPLDQLTEGDELTVSFTASFASSSLDGCARIQDDLPANVLPLATTQFRGNVPVFFQGDQVSFLACKGDTEVPELSYRAKVMARGSFRAEPAVMQHLDTPSVATYSTEQILIVR